MAETTGTEPTDTEPTDTGPTGDIDLKLLEFLKVYYQDSKHLKINDHLGTKITNYR